MAPLGRPTATKRSPRIGAALAKERLLSCVTLFPLLIISSGALSSCNVSHLKPHERNFRKSACEETVGREVSKSSVCSFFFQRFERFEFGPATVVSSVCVNTG